MLICLKIQKNISYQCTVHPLKGLWMSFKTKQTKSKLFSQILICPWIWAITMIYMLKELHGTAANFERRKLFSFYFGNITHQKKTKEKLMCHCWILLPLLSSVKSTMYTVISHSWRIALYGFMMKHQKRKTNNWTLFTQLRTITLFKLGLLCQSAGQSFSCVMKFCNKREMILQWNSWLKQCNFQQHIMTLC